MTTIRGQLTVWFTGAIVFVLAIFALALHYTATSNKLGDLDQVNRTSARLAEKVMANHRLRAALLVADTTLGGSGVGGVGGPAMTLHPDVRAELEQFSELVFVFSVDGQRLYSSASARPLDTATYNRLATEQFTLPDSVHYLTVNVGDGNVRFVGVTPSDTGMAKLIHVIWIGQSTKALDLGTSDLLSRLVLVFLFVGIFTIAAGVLVAGRALAPIDRLTGELESITDAGALHLRLRAEDPTDEIGKLTATLNAMIGRLQTSFQDLRRFTADASHELKTPLTVARVSIERAMATPSVPQPALVAMEDTLMEVNRMTELVEALLTLARTDEGGIKLHSERVEIPALIEEMYETATFLGEAAGVVVSLSREDNVAVDGDRRWLRQLFMNLITNAIKFTPEGGEVDLAVTRRDPYAIISVSDTGTGISANDLPHLFERFWRADPARTRGESTGFGLGLAISRWIAESHGGRIEVRSRLGRGSTFSVYLPVRPESAPSEES